MSSDKHCCVPGCTNSTGMHKVLHGFPNPDKDNERFKTWLNAICGTTVNIENYQIYKYRRVCHSHFEQKYLCRNDRISNIAVPTLNMPEFEVKPKRLGPHNDHNYISSKDKDVIVDDVLVGYSSIEKVYKHRNRPRFESISPKPSETVHTSTEPTLEASPVEEDHLEDHHTSADDDTEQVQFSWQNAQKISLDEDEDDSVFDDEPAPKETEGKATEDDEDDRNLIKIEKHSEYFCDSCSKEIIGFRYTCVQCDNYDLCCACESNLKHPLHFMLRVPGQKPFSEVNSILEAVREKIKILSEEAQKDGTDLEFEEIKLEEPEFEEVTADPFSEVPTPAHDLTSEPQAHTSGLYSDNTPTNDMKKSNVYITYTNRKKLKTLNFYRPGFIATISKEGKHTSARLTNYIPTSVRPMNSAEASVHHTNFTSAQSSNFTHTSVHSTNSNHTSEHPTNPNHISAQDSYFTNTSGHPSNFTHNSVHSNESTHTRAFPAVSTQISGQRSNATHTSVLQPSNFTDTNVQPSNCSHTSGQTSNLTCTSVNPTYFAHTSEPHTRETLTKNTVPTVLSQSSVDPKLLLDCSVLLTPVTHPTTQTQTVPATFTHSNEQPIKKNFDVERKNNSNRRKQDLKRKTYEDMPSKQIRNTVPEPVLEKETADEQISSEVIELDSEGQENIGEIWLEDEMENVGNQTPTQENDAQIEETVEEMWLDDTVLSLESQNSS